MRPFSLLLALALILLAGPALACRIPVDVTVVFRAAPPTPPQAGEVFSGRFVAEGQEAETARQASLADEDGASVFIGFLEQPDGLVRPLFLVPTSCHRLPSISASDLAHAYVVGNRFEDGSPAVVVYSFWPDGTWRNGIFADDEIDPVAMPLGNPANPR